MSIKGTLETFNLCELLQMLALNRKDGTLVLEAEAGVKTIYLEEGRLTFFEQDTALAGSILRMARHHRVGALERIEKAQARQLENGGHLAGILESMGLIDAERAEEFQREAALEQLFALQLTSVAGFEFVEGEARLGDGRGGKPIRPLLSVESLLLDLARMLDHWNTIIEVIPAPDEVYEGTGIAVDLAEAEDIDHDLADVVIPLLDGCRSLQSIAEACDATVYAVMRIAAALHDGGGIRAVPTEDLAHRAEDLLAGGDAPRAAPLFRRCIDRGDSAPEARLRLADALEASGQPAEAAAELDTFAALSADDDAPVVFEALVRSLRLRDGDSATAARACDYYLRRRPWLRDHGQLATEALRDLVQGATTGGRPMEAALRLKGFIDCGDAPGDDLPLLADLYAAAGARKEAAAALYQRAEQLLGAERTAPGRQLLRRTLELDPGHADARRRNLELDGVRRRRGHRARIGFILLALLGVAGVAGVTWITHTDASSAEVGAAREKATEAVAEAEKLALEAIRSFEARAAEAARGEALDGELGDAAASMRENVRATMATTDAVLAEYAKAVATAHTATRAEGHQNHFDRLSQRGKLVGKQAARVIRQQGEQAQTLLGEGLVHHRRGMFVEARKFLRGAWNLAFDESDTRPRAEHGLLRVDEYFTKCEKVAKAMRAQTEAGDLRGAFGTGIAGIRELLDSDLTRLLPFPVRMESTPPGAEVWLDGEDTGHRTPCVITYSPFHEDPVVTMRLPGRTPSITNLPDFARLRRDADFVPTIAQPLPAGPRWTVADPTDRFTALWAGTDMPLVVGDRGHLVYAVHPRTGRLVPGVRRDAGKDGMRLAGRIQGALEWRVSGHRTLTVRTPAGVSWNQVTVGRIERAPLALSGVVVVLDELGALYGFEASSGEPRWRIELGASPSHQPYATPAGVLLGTRAGGTYLVDVESGEAAAVAPAVSGPAFALPWGERTLVLGGGTGGCRVLEKDGTLTALGDARPDADRRPWVGPAGVAWLQGGVVHWLAVKAPAPVAATGLGADVEQVGVGADLLFGADTDGRLRTTRLTTPNEALWSAPLGGRAQSPPLPMDRGVYVLVEGRLVAFDI